MDTETQYSIEYPGILQEILEGKWGEKRSCGVNSAEPLATQKECILEAMPLMVEIIKGHRAKAALILQNVWCYREAAHIRFKTTVCWKDKSPKRHVGLFTKFGQKVKLCGWQYHKLHMLHWTQPNSFLLLIVLLKLVKLRILVMFSWCDTCRKWATSLTVQHSDIL